MKLVKLLFMKIIVKLLFEIYVNSLSVGQEYTKINKEYEQFNNKIKELIK